MLQLVNHHENPQCYRDLPPGDIKIEKKLFGAKNVTYLSILEFLPLQFYGTSSSATSWKKEEHVVYIILIMNLYSGAANFNPVQFCDLL